MERKIHYCKQCGREINFDGICNLCCVKNEQASASPQDEIDEIKWYNRNIALPQDKLDMLVQKICEEIEETGELDEQHEMFTELVNFREIDTTEIARTAFGKRLFYPSTLYVNAPDDIIHEMIELLRQDSAQTMLEVSHLLECLAVHGGEEVFRAFVEFEKNPPKWQEELYVKPTFYATGEKVYIKPSFYATYGGWTFDQEGNIIRTMFDTCYPIVKGTLEEKAHSPVKIGVRTNERCPQCGCTLVNMMEIDGRDSRLHFLGIDGVIKAKCCPSCIIWSGGNYFSRYAIDGEGEIAFEEEPYNTEDCIKDSGIEEMDSNSYVLGKNPVPLRYAADWDGDSAVGGFSSWLVECDIKNCPDCGKPMKYLAQIEWCTILYGMEGYIYLEICSDCKTIAVLHQQT